MSNDPTKSEEYLALQAENEALLKERRENLPLRLNEVDVHKLNLQPDEILVVKVKSNDITGEDMHNLGNGMRQYFPNNRVLVLGVETEGNIDLTVAKGSEYPEPAKYCNDCSCGKKEAAEKG